MKYFTKLPGFRRYPSGLEWRILRKIPLILLVGTLVPGMVSLLSHVLLPKWDHVHAAATVQWIDFMMIGVVTMHWSWTGTLAIGCIIVVLMKGPAYVADAYPLPEESKPGSQSASGSQGMP